MHQEQTPFQAATSFESPYALNYWTDYFEACDILILLIQLIQYFYKQLKEIS